MHRLLLFALLMRLLLPSRADACSQVPPGWQVIEAGEHRSGVPLQGVIPVAATFYESDVQGETLGPGELLEFVSITVADATGRPLSGRIEWAEAASSFLWRADNPLSPGGAYRLDYRFSNAPFPQAWEEEVTGGFTFDARATPLEPLAPAVLMNADLTEWVEPKTVCCETSRDSCPAPCGGWDGPCQACWAESYSYHPKLETMWRPDGRPHELTFVRAFARGNDDQRFEVGTIRIERSDPVELDARFELPAGSYCIQIETERLVDGQKSTSEWHCLPPERLVPVERREPSFERVKECLELPPDYDVDGPIPPEKPKEDPKTALGLATEEGGCGCTGASTGGGVWALLLLAPLLALRRR